jgi:predicted nucleic acid-binding protein
MRRTILADTTPLYAAASTRDQYHTRAQAELNELERGGWAIAATVPTLMETYTLMLHRLGIPAAHQFLDSFTGAATLIVPTEEDFAAAMVRVQSYHDQPLTLFDALLAAVSSRLALPVWTYDAHFDVLRVTRWYADAAQRES